MCLLIHKPAAVTFTTEELRDFYQRNSDGYGVMYSEGGALHYAKEIGTVEQWLAFYAKHEHREMCIHLRMRTHGDVDLENCHPYPVFGCDGVPTANTGLALMHNGILHTGNSRDTKRSDTWHYIRDYLHVILKGDPEFFRTLRFKDIVGKHIGASNRFALMDSEGHVTIVNRNTGVEYKGAWFSNTYAWSALKFMPPPKREINYYTPSVVGKTGWNSGDSAKYMKDWNDRTKGTVEQPKKSRKTPAQTAGTSDPSKAGTGKKSKPDAQVSADHGTTLISQDWVGDVLEARSLLDSGYPDNMTRDKDLENMLKRVGPSNLFGLLTMMLNGDMTSRKWDELTKSPKALDYAVSSLSTYTSKDEDYELTYPSVQ